MSACGHLLAAIARPCPVCAGRWPDPCFECGHLSDHAHHVVPRVLGGTRTVPLCERCHGVVHDRAFVRHRTLTVEGLRRARRNSVQLGRPRMDGPRPADVRRLRKRGLSWAEVAKELECKVGVARLRAVEGVP